jgi:hypothetical protein
MDITDQTVVGMGGLLNRYDVIELSSQKHAGLKHGQYLRGLAGFVGGAAGHRGISGERAKIVHLSTASPK